MIRGGNFISFYQYQCQCRFCLSIQFLINSHINSWVVHWVKKRSSTQSSAPKSTILFSPKIMLWCIIQNCEHEHIQLKHTTRNCMLLAVARRQCANAGCQRLAYGGPVQHHRSSGRAQQQRRATKVVERGPTEQRWTAHRVLNTSVWKLALLG